MRQVKQGRAVAGASLGALAMLLASGCSFDFSIGGPAAVDSEDVAEQASLELEQQIGRAPDDLTCSEDLPAEVDSSIRCELTDGGQTYGVTVTTTAVEGSDVEFDVLVDEQPGG